MPEEKQPPTLVKSDGPKVMETTNPEKYIKKFSSGTDSLALIKDLASKADFSVLGRGSGTLELNRLQISQILAACFLGTTEARENCVGKKLNFENWFVCTEEDKQKQQMILNLNLVHCLLNYFDVVSNAKEGFLQERVSFGVSGTRPLGGVTENQYRGLSNVQVDTKLNHCSDQQTAKILIVDNKKIGEQLCSGHCFQEEIEYVTHPELMLAALFDDLKDGDALVVRGVRQYSLHSGFEETFKFQRTTDGYVMPGPPQTTILVKVGVVRDEKLVHYTKESFNNAIKAAFAGMNAAKDATSVSFQFWGFSDINVPKGYAADRAMMVDPGVIFLVLWIAASMTFKDLVFRQLLNYNLGKDILDLYGKIQHTSIQSAYRELKSYCDCMTVVQPGQKIDNLVYDTIKLKPGYQKVPVNNQEEIWSWTYDKMQKSIVDHGKMTIKGYKIKNVFKIFNYRLWERFLERKHEINQDLISRGLEYRKKEENRLFHGTNAAEAISKTGFKKDFCSTDEKPVKKMFGHGLYFADLSSKSNQYTLDGVGKGCLSHNSFTCEVCTRTLLICRVMFGKKYMATKANHDLREAPDNCHSLEANPQNMLEPLRYPEYVVYNDYQAYPGFIVEYTAVAGS